MFYFHNTQLCYYFSYQIFMLILSTAGQHCVRTFTGYLFTEHGSDSHKVMNRKVKKS